MKKQFIGYIFAGLGVIVLLLSFEQPRSAFPFLQNIPTSIIVTVGVILVAIGVVFMVMTGGKKEKKLEEVPIYKGKQIVGYRQH
jgi:protein-S-isoprenylcysteine O-methyltransferase Ste14